MRIAIVKLSAMGDIVHAMIVLQFIKKFNNKISIDWFVEERFKDLLKFNPHINNLHLVKFKNARNKRSILMLLRELDKLRNHDIYDLVIDMQGLIKSSIISKLLPSKQIIGFDKFSVRESLASNFYNKKLNCSYETNVIERNIALIEFALSFNVEKQQVINKVPFIHSNVKELGFKIKKSKKNILLIPGASYSSKRYSVESFAKLVHSLDANYHIIWGSTDEKFLAKEIKKRAPKVEICPKLSIEELAYLISQLDLVIGSDTGPTHMAWALNIPSITLFGPTPGYRNTYITNINKVLESNSEVIPKKINKNDFSINTININDIAKLASQLLVKK